MRELALLGVLLDFVQSRKRASRGSLDSLDCLEARMSWASQPGLGGLLFLALWSRSLRPEFFTSRLVCRQPAVFLLLRSSHKLVLSRFLCG